jgi:hypothetical protein
MREGWKDVQVEWLLLRQELGSAQGQIRETVHGTTQAVGHSVRNLVNEQRQGHLKQQLQEIQADWKVQQRLLQQDVQEFLALGNSWKAQIVERRRRESTTTSSTQGEPSPQSSHSHDSTPTTTTVPSSEFFTRAIRNFESSLQDPQFMNTLNEEIIPAKLSSCQEMIQYYRSRPELYDYTLTKELSRMKYTVFTEGGQKLTDISAILEYAAAQQQEQQQSQVSSDNDLLWRAANQSIFGDVITSLTCDQGLLRPLFHTASSVNDLTLTIDFGRDAPHITAECFAHVILPGTYDESKANDANDQSQEKLELAGALIGVYFCPKKNRMEAKILHISPAPSLTNDQVKGIAETLAYASKVAESSNSSGNR